MSVRFVQNHAGFKRLRIGAGAQALVRTAAASVAQRATNNASMTSRGEAPIYEAAQGSSGGVGQVGRGRGRFRAIVVPANRAARINESENGTLRGSL